MSSDYQVVGIVLPDGADLAGEQLERFDACRRYWAVASWDPVKSRVQWAESVSGIVASSGVSDGKLRGMLLERPVRIEQVVCACGAPLYFWDRQMVQRAVRGDARLCESCLSEKSAASRRKAEKDRREFEALERKIRAAFKAVLCDDRRPEGCVNSLEGSAVTLYHQMLKQQQEDAPLLRQWLGVDEHGKDIFQEPHVTLLDHWSISLDTLKYVKSGPDLYALAQHRLVVPLSYMAREVTLTHHGLINPSGYPYLRWSVQEELDGWPLAELMRKRLNETQTKESDK